MDVDLLAGEMNWRDVYRLAIGFVNPRPIALASTISPQGQTNLAPYSFYNMVSANPPTVIVCPGLRRDGTPKDTLINIRETGEFVVATVTAELAEKMVLCSADLPYGDSEFSFAGLTERQAHHVRAPLVAEAKVNIECRLKQIVVTGDQPGSASVVFGEIIALHIDDGILSEDRRSIDPEKLPTVGRLGGQSYSNVAAPYEMPRPKV